MTEYEIRKRMAGEAVSVVGLTGNSPAHQALLGPPLSWPLHLPYGKGGMSTCAMVALGLLRRCGVDDERIQRGYRIGSGLWDAIKLARKHGAWIKAAPGTGPKVGDIVQVLGPMHVATVIGWRRDDDGLACVSVDGGQVDPDTGLQCVAMRDRSWTEQGGQIIYGGRVVDGWIDIARLPYKGA